MPVGFVDRTHRGTMDALIVALLLVLVLTGTLSSVLGVVAWILLAIVGGGIIHCLIVEPIQRRRESAQELRRINERARLGYGEVLSEAELQMVRRRRELGYGC